MPTHRLCAIVPVYNHGATVAGVVRSLRAQGLDTLLVDDGSAPDCATVLDGLVRTIPGTWLLRRRDNGGKGAAVLDGLRAAAGRGYSHALQIDADGQHALADVAQFAALSRAHPQALVCGAPIYGDDAPRARLYGRWITRVWVWINTLALDIPDAMCGFRIYPLAATLPVIDNASIGRRMDFDISIIVRLHWRNVPMVWLPTRVMYPGDGISHFHALRDNLLISKEHARLFFGMLGRLPLLLARRALRRTGA
ncbi:Glycosyl transferase family 2 [Pigmentiphaga humi]|uniref:Glycosyl transferase family 2 n=1 Tax=Pigmentiphaga humi TaxID=2478468 RepID=A0A3P4B633_9BURK|nr:glycosyltransferase family 2 protein [Pigmentiphaga humi]VCU71371.1 Glycosyl transferase family 2 [Pigmentiphaga humi]